MEGDVKITTKIYEYPRVEDFTSLNEKELETLIEDNREFWNKYAENEQYYIGANVAIASKREVDKDNPDSRVAVPYARTMTQIVKGYMYKAGLITYDSDNEQYMQVLQEIFDRNDETLKTSELGESQSKYGLGVELLYIDDKAELRFTNVNPKECIFLFNMEIEPKLSGALRYYVIDEDKDKLNSKTYKLEVYYLDRIEIYTLKEDSFNKFSVVSKDDQYPNVFKEIPFVIYKNNQEYHADYEPVKPLVDAYDILASDSTNELNRFASAYLILKDYVFSNPDDDNMKTRELEKLKSRRVLEFLDGQGGAEFLTKDIPSEFFEAVKGTLREDIEYHSHIPDFRSKNFSNASGVSMMWALFDFENFCSDKETLFSKGLQHRIDLINIYLGIRNIQAEKVNIRFKRNTPVNLTELIDNAVKLKNGGILSDEDILKTLPEDLVDNVDDALERLKAQRDENMQMFDIEGGSNGDQGFNSRDQEAQPNNGN